MNLPETLRPGIYTQVSVTPIYTTPRGRLSCGLVAQAASHQGERLVLESYRQGAQLLSTQGDKPLLELIAILFSQGVAGVVCVPVSDTPTDQDRALADYEAAFAQLSGVENLGAIVCDSENTAVLKALKTSVLESVQTQKERFGIGATGDPDRALALANELNCERMLLCCGKGLVAGQERPCCLAASLAGAILGADDPAVNLNSAQMTGVEGLLEELTALEVEKLLRAGVIPFEKAAGKVECIRAVTTRTRTDGLEDATYRSLNTVLIIDHMMATLRGALRSRLQGSRNNPQTRESVRTQVALELSQAVEEGYLESYGDPRVYPHAEDPGVCVVEVAFTVAQVVNQIVIVAQIRV